MERGVTRETAYAASMARLAQLGVLALQQTSRASCLLCGSQDYVGRDACFQNDPALCSACRNKEIQHVFFVTEYHYNPTANFPTEGVPIPAHPAVVQPKTRVVTVTCPPPRRAASIRPAPDTKTEAMTPLSPEMATAPENAPGDRKRNPQMAAVRDGVEEWIASRRARCGEPLRDIKDDVPSPFAAPSRLAWLDEPVAWGRKFNVQVQELQPRSAFNAADVFRARHASAQEYARSVTASARGLRADAMSLLYCKEHNYHGLDACPDCRLRTRVRWAEDFAGRGK